MTSLKHFLDSSIGKKYTMAISGMMLCGFLMVHAIGNTTIFWGSDAFNSYAKHLHSLGFFIYVFEVCLFSLFMIHIHTGASLFLQNRRAKGNRYAVKKSAGGKTIASSTMFYTGIIILAFTILHLLNFRLVPDGTLISTTVGSLLANPLYTFLYTTAMLAVGLHISHGIWSSFQSLGINHSKYNGLILAVNWGIAVFVTAVFLTVVILLIINKNHLL
jgi:succinate dehydrogenase / fumarate reductase cytochrome b subunit